MVSTKRIAKPPLTISGLLKSRAIKFTRSVAIVMLAVFVLAQCYIVNVAFNKARGATEGWINLNKQRIEQALFLENALAIKGLLEETSGLKLDHQQILGVDVRNTSDNRVVSAGDISTSPTNFLAELATGRLVSREVLDFADRPQGSLVVYTSIDRSQILASALIALLIILGASVMIELLARVLIRDIRVRVLDPLSRLTDTLSTNRKSVKDLLNLDPIESSTAEVQDLVSSYNKMMEQLIALADQEQLQAELKNKIEIATQVSHDIRSPVSALQMVLAVTTGLKPEERQLIQAAVSRIHSIAENLLEKSRLASIELSAGSFDLVSALGSIVREKIIETGHENISLEFDVPSLEVRGDAEKFKTVVSNLLNNALESIESKQSTIAVVVSTRETSVLIRLIDQGRGIPSEVLRLLGQAPVSFGKARGNGIGVLSAVRTIESFGGTLTLASEVGVGTTVSIELRLKMDEILIRDVDLGSRTHVVVVDDDATVASMWRMTLPPGVALTSFATPEECAEKLASFEPSTLFLIDHRFENSPMTGLELINKLQLQEQAILVTSDAYDPGLRTSVRQSRIRLMSKDDISTQRHA